MKRCPACNRTYPNDEFAFCLADGALLSAPYDLEKTQLINEPLRSQLQVTETLTANKSYDDKERTDANTTKTSGSRRKWNEGSFLQEIAKHPKKRVAASLRKLYFLSKDTADKVDFGTGTQRASFNVKFNHINPRSLYTVYSDGTMWLNFAWLRDNERSAAAAERIGQESKKLFGRTIPDDFREKYVKINPEQWAHQIPAFMIMIYSATKKERSEDAK